MCNLINHCLATRSICPLSDRGISRLYICAATHATLLHMREKSGFNTLGDACDVD